MHDMLEINTHKGGEQFLTIGLQRRMQGVPHIFPPFRQRQETASSDDCTTVTNTERHITGARVAATMVTSTAYDGGNLPS